MQQSDIITYTTNYLDILIFVSYILIPIQILWFKRRYSFVIQINIAIVLFALFILGCSVTHLLNYPSFNNYNYLRFFAKAFTCLVSVITSIFCFFVLPTILEIPDKLYFVINENENMKNFRDISNKIRNNDSHDLILDASKNEICKLFPQYTVSFSNQNINNGCSFKINDNLFLNMAHINSIDFKLPIDFINDIVDIIRYSIELRVNIQNNNNMIVDLENRNKQLVKNNQNELNFLAHISHELRSPLSGIVSMCGILISTDISEEQSEYVNVIEDASKMVLKLINDLLNLRKIDNNKMKMEIVENDINKTLEECYSFFSHNTRKKHLSFNVNNQIPEGLLLYFDEMRIQQILHNLCSNAIKFTENGSLDVDLFLSNESDKKCNLNIVVKDTGMGINPERLDQIFEEFSQDISTQRIYGGTGLGLSIVSRLVRLMNGQINVSSELNKGTTFKILIEMNKFTRDFMYSTKKARKYKNILVCNDILHQNDTLLYILKNTDNGNVLFCENIKQGNYIIENKLESFDLVILDSNSKYNIHNLQIKNDIKVIYIDDIIDFGKCIGNYISSSLFLHHLNM